MKAITLTEVKQQLIKKGLEVTEVPYNDEQGIVVIAVTKNMEYQTLSVEYDFLEGSILYRVDDFEGNGYVIQDLQEAIELAEKLSKEYANKNKGYEGLQKDSYEEYVQIMEDMDIDVKTMFKLIDEGNVDKYRRSFLTSYVDWQKLKKLLLQHSYNDCGHKLHSDIEKAYQHIISTYADELYYTF